MGKNLPVAVGSFGVDRDDDALAAKYFGGLGNEVRAIDGPGIDRNFISPGLEKPSDIFDFVDSSSHRERHENLLCGARNHVQNDLTVLVGGSNVEETEFVCTLAIVYTGNFNGVPCIPELQELYPFDDAPGLDVETRDDSLCEHRPFFNPDSAVKPEMPEARRNPGAA